MTRNYIYYTPNRPISRTKSFDRFNVHIFSANKENERQDYRDRDQINDSSYSKDYIDYSWRKPNVEIMKDYNKRIHRNIQNPFKLNIRKKRQYTEDNDAIKPFWEHNILQQKIPQAKSLRYTTLQRRKNVKNMKTSKQNQASTESITINSNSNNVPLNITNHKYPVKEKFLSFDELISLRRFNEENSRRSDGETTTTATTTESVMFSKISHCTRKITCTWTLAFPEGGDDSGGGNNSRKTRTPPGYVEGCTRTSTCTRDFMERNKEPPSSTEETSTTEDKGEDYCER